MWKGTLENTELQLMQTYRTQNKVHNREKCSYRGVIREKLEPASQILTVLN